MAGLYTNYKGAWGTSEIQASLRQEWQHKRPVCCVAQESSEEGSNEEKDKEVVVEKDVQVVAEEKLEEINLGSDSQ